MNERRRRLADLAVQHYPAVYGTALAIVADCSLAEEIAQETFVAFLTGCRQVESDDLAPYLRGIARNLCRREFRRQRYAQGLGDQWRQSKVTTVTPETTATTRDDLSVVQRQLTGLSPIQRDVLVLYYLHDCSQRQVAGLLGIAVTRVNNILHAARTKLRNSYGSDDMMKEKLTNHTIPADFVDRVGRIVEVRGPIVDITFDTGRLPDYADYLVVADDNGDTTASLSVVQRTEDRVLCVTTEGRAPTAPGAHVAPVVVERAVEVPTAVVTRLLDEASPRPTEMEMVETGIKCIDLLCPIVRGGRVALVGPRSAGRFTLITELCQRLSTLDQSGRVTLVTYLDHVEADLFHQARSRYDEPLWTEYDDGVMAHINTFYLPSRRGGDPALADCAIFDTVICLDMVLGVRGIWPAVGFRGSTSRLLIDRHVGAEHQSVVADVWRALTMAQDLTSDREALALVANDAFAAARDRFAASVEEALDTMRPERRTEAERALKVEAFLSTPFFCAEDFNGQPGQSVGLQETLDGCRRILAGEADHLAVDDLKMVGALPIR